MRINFHKYQGTGNDFIMIDCTDRPIELSVQQISDLCNRRFGIGADGLICIYKHDHLDFEMKYYNSDGSRSFCGNGARCAVAFAHKLGLFDKEVRFEAIDGEHSAIITDEEVSLKMNDVNQIERDDSSYVIETGSPHYISFVDNIEQQDIVSFGKKIRYSETYKNQGINVNLVAISKENSIEMLTYERGVEDETLSCGTGATAAALALLHKNQLKSEATVQVKVKGGRLKVKAIPSGDGFKAVYLIGPATYVFNGSITI